MPELTLTLDQGTIRYHDEGSGPTVVFIHGALVDGRLWQPVVHRLQGDLALQPIAQSGHAL